MEWVDMMLLGMRPSGLGMADRLTLLVYRVESATAGRMIVQSSRMDEWSRGMQQESLVLPDHRRAHTVRPSEALMAQDPVSGWVLRAGRYGRTGSGTATGVAAGTGASGSRGIHVDGRVVLDVLQSVVPIAAGPRFGPELATLQRQARHAGVQTAEDHLAIGGLSLSDLQSGRIGLVVLREGMQRVAQGASLIPGASHGIGGLPFLDTAEVQAVVLDTVAFGE